MLVDGLLWSDVGQSLLKVVDIGIDMVDKLFAVHGRWDAWDQSKLYIV